MFSFVKSKKDIYTANTEAIFTQHIADEKSLNSTTTPLQESILTQRALNRLTTILSLTEEFIRDTQKNISSQDRQEAILKVDQADKYLNRYVDNILQDGSFIQIPH